MEDKQGFGNLQEREQAILSSEIVHSLLHAAKCQLVCMFTAAFSMDRECFLTMFKKGFGVCLKGQYKATLNRHKLTIKKSVCFVENCAIEDAMLTMPQFLKFYIDFVHFNS